MASEYARPKFDEGASKKERRQRRGARRMAGEAMKEEGFDRKEYRESHYDVDKLDDFNLRATGSGSAIGKADSKNPGKGKAAAKLSGQDIRGLAATGEYSGKQLQNYIGRLDKRKEAGEDVKVGQGARNFLDKFMANEAAKKKDGGGGGDDGGGGGDDGGGTAPNPTPTPAPAPTPTPAPAPAPTPTATNSTNVIDQRKKFSGDNKNRINNSTIHGNVNQCNQDFSVNIQGGGTDGGVSNMGSSAAYGGLNEQQYQKSQELYNPSASVAGAISSVADTTGLQDFADSVNFSTQKSINSWRDRSAVNTANIFGDLANFKTPEWKGGYSS